MNISRYITISAAWCLLATSHTMLPMMKSPAKSTVTQLRCALLAQALQHRGAGASHTLSQNPASCIAMRHSSSWIPLSWYKKQEEKFYKITFPSDKEEIFKILRNTHCAEDMEVSEELAGKTLVPEGVSNAISIGQIKYMKKTYGYDTNKAGKVYRENPAYVISRNAMLRELLENHPQARQALGLDDSNTHKL